MSMPSRGPDLAWLRWLTSHPTVALALKAGVATGLAFFLGSLLPSPLAEYKYYAALGAFTVVGLIVVDSIKESLRVFGAVSIGVGTAVLVQGLAWTNPLFVGIAVLACVLLGALPVLGTQRKWAPLAALFVLATGGADPEPMAVGYLIQVPLGATVGIVVNLVLFAPLGVRDLDQSAWQVRQLISRHLGDYADILDEQAEGSLEDDAVARRTATVTTNLNSLERAQAGLLAAIADEQRAQRANPRARRRSAAAARVAERAEALSRCAGALGSVAVMLQQAEAPATEAGRAIRREASGALRRAATAFEDPGAVRADGDLMCQIREGLDRMIRHVHDVGAEGGLDHLLLGALALSVRQCLEIFAREVADPA